MAAIRHRSTLTAYVEMPVTDDECAVLRVIDAAGRTVVNTVCSDDYADGRWLTHAAATLRHYGYRPVAKWRRARYDEDADYEVVVVRC